MINSLLDLYYLIFKKNNNILEKIQKLVSVIIYLRKIISFFQSKHSKKVYNYFFLYNLYSIYSQIFNQAKKKPNNNLKSYQAKAKLTYNKSKKIKSAYLTFFLQILNSSAQIPSKLSLNLKVFLLALLNLKCFLSFWTSFQYFVSFLPD